MFKSSLPILILVLGSIVTMLQSLSPKMNGKHAIKISILFFLGISLLFFIFPLPSSSSLFSVIYQLDSYSKLFILLLFVTLISLCGLAINSYLEANVFEGKVASILQISLLSMVMVICSENLCVIFLGMELNSIAFFALAGFIRPNRFSLEGALKYFLLGSFASAILVFGLSLLYACAGTLQLNLIISALRNSPHSLPWVPLGSCATLIGFAFKMSLAPCQLWTPDTYEASPTIITGYLSISSILLTTNLAMKVFTLGAADLASPWFLIFTAIVGISVVFASILALVQTSIKRILAYSTISQSGYLTIILCSLPTSSAHTGESIVFYLISFTISSIVAFGIIMSLENKNQENLNLDDLKGLAYCMPWYAIGISIALASLAGVPTTVGFISKLFLFVSVVDQKSTLMIALVAVCNCISLFHYLRIILFMYLSDPSQKSSKFSPKPSCFRAPILISACLAAILLGTFLPGHTLELIAPMIRSKLSIP